MVSSGMLRRVVLVRTDISEELGASSIIRVTKCLRNVGSYKSHTAYHQVAPAAC
jgi:hypothetical protein